MTNLMNHYALSVEKAYAIAVTLRRLIVPIVDVDG
jgi:hypothetical protein